jgi:L-asparaginase
LELFQEDITTTGAITKLMYLLQQGIAPDEFKTIFETSLRGEYILIAFL